MTSLFINSVFSILPRNRIIGEVWTTDTTKDVLLVHDRAFELLLNLRFQKKSESYKPRLAFVVRYLNIYVLVSDTSMKKM